MKSKSERGQGLVEIVLILSLVLIAALTMMALTANLEGMKRGANTLGNAAGNIIDKAAEDQEWRNLDWQIANGAVVSAWVNNQRIPTTDHIIANHGAAGVEAINCYNDHGVFFIQANKPGDWYFHCLEEDNRTVRTTIWQRVGNEFHLETAYTKGDGAWSWAQVRTFFENKWGATKAKFPIDGVLYVDGVSAPYIP